jgi:hypothetical protein
VHHLAVALALDPVHLSVPWNYAKK